MNAELQILRQIVLSDRISDDGEIFIELFFKLSEIAYVIDAFVEPAGELWRDSLRGNRLVGNGRENDKQFDRGLRSVRLIHRNFGNELPLSLRRFNLPIKTTCLLNGFQVLAGNSL